MSLAMLPHCRVTTSAFLHSACHDLFGLVLTCTCSNESPVTSWQVDPKTTLVTHWLLTISHANFMYVTWLKVRVYIYIVYIFSLYIYIFTKIYLYHWCHTKYISSVSHPAKYIFSVEWCPNKVGDIHISPTSHEKAWHCLSEGQLYRNASKILPQQFRKNQKPRDCAKISCEVMQKDRIV